MVTDRTPPNDKLAEQHVLGCCMVQPGAVAELTISGSDFYQPTHEAIWSAITTLTAKSIPCDIPAVNALMTERGQGHLIGHGVYLVELTGNLTVTANVGYYAAIVKDRAGRRALIAELSRGLQDAYESEDPFGDITSRAEGRLAKIGSNDEVSELHNFAEFLAQPIPTEDWVIPGLMDRGDRLVLTGTEGLGKASGCGRWRSVPHPVSTRSPRNRLSQRRSCSLMPRTRPRS